MRIIPLANTKLKNGVLVFIQIEDNEISEVSLELVCKARELANDLKVDVISLLIGAEGNSDFEQSLINYGSNIVYTFNDHRLDHYETLPYTKIVSTIINRAKPQIVLFAPRLWNGNAGDQELESATKRKS